MHHEQVILPNGNILAICKETITSEDNFYSNEDLKIDKIIEIEPIENDQANIIWEWHFYDHLIQDYDPEISNYGNISENPQLFNIYAYNNFSDYTHLNCLFNSTIIFFGIEIFLLIFFLYLFNLFSPGYKILLTPFILGVFFTLFILSLIL